MVMHGHTWIWMFMHSSNPGRRRWHRWRIPSKGRTPGAHSMHVEGREHPLMSHAASTGARMTNAASTGPWGRTATLLAAQPSHSPTTQQSPAGSYAVGTQRG